MTYDLAYDRHRAAQTVAKHYGVPVRLILSNSRAQRLVEVRQKISFLLRHIGLGTLAEIGETLGGLDPHTVKYGADKVQKMAAGDAALAAELKELSDEIEQQVNTRSRPLMEDVAQKVISGEAVSNDELLALASDYLERAA